MTTVESEVGSRALARGWHGRRPHTPALLWVPAALVGAAVLLPLVYLIIRTIGAGEEALDLLLRGRTLQVLVRTILLALAVTGAAALLAVPLAWLTVRTDLPLRGLWSVLTVLPLVIPSYVGGFVLVAAFGPRGMFQEFVAGPFLGVERLPDIYGFPGAMLALTLFTFPYMMLSVRAALWGLDQALEETSRSLGHGAWSTFFYVTLPQLRPAIAAGALLVALYTLSDFGAVSLLRFESFTQQIYVQYQSSFDRTLAAVFSLVLVTLTMVILLGEARARGRARYHRSTVGAPRPPRMIRLGRWRWPALSFCGAVVFLALIVPMAVLIYWLVKGLGAGEPLELVWSAAWNSLYASGLAAVVVVAAALPVAILAVRYPGVLSGLLERTAFLGFALPGIVVALALVFFGANFATPLYQSMAMLIFAYMLLFLPQAVGVARASLLQVSPRLEEAARGLGYPLAGVLARIVIPLVWRGLLAGGALVFLTVMKELPATLLLSPIGFQTLAMEVWGAASEGFFARAAAPALMLIVLSSVPVAFIVLRERGPAS